MSKNQSILVKHLGDRRKSCNSSNVKVIPNQIIDKKVIVISQKEIYDTKQRIDKYRDYFKKVFDK